MKQHQDHHEYCTGGFDPDDIVITGIAGRFPQCENVGELKEGLYTQKQLLFFNSERFEKGACNLPVGSAGEIKDLDKFECDYFRLPPTVVNAMDPGTRKLLEVTYEAIVDSGYEPSSLNGANIGVYNALVNDDSLHLNIERGSSMPGFTFLRCMNANRVSYAFNFIGPSLSHEVACSSSSAAVHTAFRDLKDGKVDAAIVNASHLNLHPQIAHIYWKMGMMSVTGESKPFEESANGIVRSEAVVAIFLQKASVARRVYGSILCSKFISCGFVPEGISVPSRKIQLLLNIDILKEAGIQPNDVDYIEAHGTGTPVGDPIELNAIADAYCNHERKKPLYIGSIKSNIGHTEAASGLCGLLKAVFALDSGIIAPQFDFQKPNPKCKALLDGKMIVLKNTTPLHNPYIPVNSFGIGGTLVQFLLKQNPKTLQNSPNKKSGLPKFVLTSSTTESAVEFIFEYIKNNPDLPDEFFALLNKLSFAPLHLKPFRGYALYQEGRSNITSNIKCCSPDKREVWYVFPGVGSQWYGMGKKLMEIEVFAASIRRSAQILEPYGYNLIDVLSADKSNVSDVVLFSLVGICVIQIALVDVLREIGIHPDKIIGHSTGELGCAYADGCTTQEEFVLSSYFRGISVRNANLPPGAMAAVGLSWEEAKELCPESIFLACHNADDSVTISGPKDDIEKFVEKLRKDNIFAKTVDSFGYAFHTKYVEGAVELMKKHGKEIIQNPKPRTSRWISSSFPESQWNDKICKVAGNEYFMHNFKSPVLFNEATKKIPSDAILIEIGPHCLLQSVLKRAVGPNATTVGLMKKNDPDNLKFFFESIGKLYQAGLDPKIEKLYPAIQFPVPRQIPCISDLIKWKHTTSFDVQKWKPKSGGITHKFSLDGDDSYLLDHFIDGRSLFPATGYMVLAWEMLATKLQKNYKQMPVTIENFKIHRATVINPKMTLIFNCNMLSDSGEFEILDGTAVVATGQVYEWKKGKSSIPDPVYHPDDDSAVAGEDIYSELKMTGYEYGPSFQGLETMDIEGTQGLVLWRNQWIPFLDSCLLFFGIVTNSDEFYLPTGALSIKIDPNLINERAGSGTEPKSIPVNFDRDTQICHTVGIEISKLVMDLAPNRVKDDNPTLEKHVFIPYTFRYVPEKESDRSLLQYMWACNKVLDAMAKSGVDINGHKFKNYKVFDKGLDEYIASIGEEHVLLKLLKVTLENTKCVKKKLQELCSPLMKSLGKDLINSLMTDGYPLKVMLDIIAENSYKKLNITELNNFGSTFILPNILQLGKKYAHLRCKTGTLIADDVSEVDQDIVSELGIQLNGKSCLERLSTDKDQDVVVSSFFSGSSSELRTLVHNLSSIVKSDGFILFYHKEKVTPVEEFLLSLCDEKVQIQSRHNLENIFQENSLVVLSTIFDSFGSAAYLLRPVAPCVSYKILNVDDSRTYSWVEKLKRALVVDGKSMLWLVSEDSPTNGILGMVNCLKQEPGGERIRCVFISQKDGEEKPPPFSFEKSFYKQLLTMNLAFNVWREGSWGSLRHVQINSKKGLKDVEHSFVNCKKYGDLSSFEWVESRVKYTQIAAKKLVHIYYSAMNFRDVMLATGKLSIETAKQDKGSSDDSVLGLEFSGRDQSGRRVAGITPSRGMATAAIVDPVMMIDVPDSWSLEEASTVPVVYSTSYYALVLRANLRPEQSILIHSATGGIGISATHIALSYNCEVFATVGNEEKRQYLKRLFPKIKDENIGCSRDTSFENMVMQRTKGRGVDMVLNSLADDKFQASVRCVAKHGHFIEIGKYDLSLDRKLGLKTFLKNISFHAVMLDQLFEDTPFARKEFHRVMELVREGIKKAVVKPLDRTVFKRDELEQAFRYMAKGVHVGKVILKIMEEEVGKSIVSKTLILPAVPNTYFFSHKSYIVIGGLSGFGIELTKWILGRGGRNVILTSRRGIRTPYHRMCLKRWRNIGFNVQVLNLDASKQNEAVQLIKEASKFGAVGGIFNSAVVLQDAFFDCQSAKAYSEVCAPKATATLILDELTRKMCSAVDYFVCFSSISCGKGNAGQSNYGYANSVMERVCEQRRNDGLHGLAIQWGIIGDVGIVHRSMGDDAMIAGVRAQSVKSCLESLDLFCQNEYPVVCSYVTAVEKKKTNEQIDVVSQIAKVLGMSEISDFRNLGDMGMDSLMSVEVKQLVESHFDISITMQELLEMKISDIRALTLSTNSDTTICNTEKLSTENMKLPPLLVYPDSLICLNKEAGGVPVFIVSIGNSDVANFRGIAESIGVPLFVLCRTNSTPLSDVKALAAWYLKLIQSKELSAFHLIGYSFGGSVALEMALQDESTAKNMKSITLLDASSHLIQSLSKETDSKLEVSSLCDFIEQFSMGAVPGVEDELLKAKTLEDRKNIIFNLLKDCVSQTSNKTELMDVISDHVKLSKLIHSYAPRKKLSKDILLVEDPMQVLPNDISEIKTSISQFCGGKIIIQRLLSRKDLCSKDMIEGLVALLKERF